MLPSYERSLSKGSDVIIYPVIAMRLVYPFTYHAIILLAPLAGIDLEHESSRQRKSRSAPEPEMAHHFLLRC